MEMYNFVSQRGAAPSHKKSLQGLSVRHKEKLILRYKIKKQADLKLLDLLLQLHHYSLFIFYLGIQLAHFKFFPGIERKILLWQFALKLQVRILQFLKSCSIKLLMYLKMKTILMYCNLHENTFSSEQQFPSQASACICAVILLVLCLIQKLMLFSDSMEKQIWQSQVSQQYYDRLGWTTLESSFFTLLL